MPRYGVTRTRPESKPPRLLRIDMERRAILLELRKMEAYIRGVELEYQPDVDHPQAHENGMYQELSEAYDKRDRYSAQLEQKKEELELVKVEIELKRSNSNNNYNYNYNCNSANRSMSRCAARSSGGPSASSSSCLLSPPGSSNLAISGWPCGSGSCGRGGRSSEPHEERMNWCGCGQLGHGDVARRCCAGRVGSE